MNIRRIWSVLVVNLRDFIRDKGGLFFTFAFPIILMLLFGFIFSDNDETRYDIHVQDLDGTQTSENLTGMLRQMENFKVRTIGPQEDLGRFVDEGRGDFIIVIPNGYEQAVIAGLMDPGSSRANITVMMDESRSSSMAKYSILDSSIDSMNERMINATDIVSLQGRSIFARDYKYIDFFIPGVIGMTVMTGAVFGTIFGDTELRKKGIFRKLSTTPITRGEWILSTMLFQLALAALSAIVILLVGLIVFGARFYLNPVAALTIVFEAFAFTGLAMLVVRFVKDAQAASALGNAITFPMMFLSGTFFEVSSMPGFIQAIAKVLPLYYVNEAIREAMVFNDTIDAMKNLAVIAVFAVIVFIAGVAFTSWRQD